MCLYCRNYLVHSTAIALVLVSELCRLIDQEELFQQDSLNFTTAQSACANYRGSPMNKISAAICPLLPMAVISLSAHHVVEGFSIPIMY